jgi:hypothetical protein
MVITTWMVIISDCERFFKEPKYSPGTGYSVRNKLGGYATRCEAAVQYNDTDIAWLFPSCSSMFFKLRHLESDRGQRL